MGTGWSSRFLYTGERVRGHCGLRSHTGRTVAGPGSFTPVGRRQGAPSFTSPFWKRVAGCLNGHPQGTGWNGDLSLFFSVSCPSCLYLSLSPQPILPSPLSWKLCVIKCYHWYLCEVVLSVHQLLQVFADIVVTVEHWRLEIQTSLHCLGLGLVGGS